MKKILLAIFLSLCLVLDTFAYFEDVFIYTLNPDPYSQAAGASIMAQSPSVFGLFTNPASNYKTVSKEVQLSYTSVYNNIYGLNAGIVIPTERSGNFSVLVSGFDFNKDSEVVEYDSLLMLAVNYVLPLTEMYPIFTEKGSAGINLKYYNLKTKDDTTGIFDVDLGVVYSLDFIDNDLMGAATIKNLGNDIEYKYIENDTTYDYSVKQHTNFTLSAKYLISELYNVCLMADMVKDFQITDMGYAVAADFVPVNPLTLRVGWRDYRDSFNKGITAGFSIDLDRINLAYAFSDIYNSDDDQHIFSLGMYLGKIPDRGKAYDHYLGYYMNKARSQYERKNYISARKQFEEILAVYPEEPVAKKYLQMLSEDLYQADIDKEKKIDKYLARADAALMRNNLLRAKSYYSKVLVLENTNAAAKEGLAKAEAELEEQLILARRKKNAKVIAKHWTDAMVHYNNGEFVFAKEDFNKILEIDPENAGAKQYLGFIEQKVKKVNRIQANDLFKHGLEYLEAEDYEQALKYFNTAYISDETRTDIKEYIDKCEQHISAKKEKENEAYRTGDAAKAKRQEQLKTNKEVEEEITSVYNKGIEQYNKGNYEAALIIFNRVDKLSTQYKFYNYSSAVKNYIKRCKSANSKGVLSEAKNLELREEFLEAYNKYNSVLKLDPENSEAKSAVQRLKAVLAQRYYDLGLQAYSSGDRKKAEEMLQESLKYDSNKLETKIALDKIKSK